MINFFFAYLAQNLSDCRRQTVNHCCVLNPDKQVCALVYCRLVDCFLVDIPVKSLSFSATGMFLATVHVGDLGVYLWSNMTMFGSAVLTALPNDYEPSVLALPSTEDQTRGNLTC